MSTPVKRAAPRPKSDYQVRLSQVINALDLEVVTDGNIDLDKRMVATAELNRPGIQWSGYLEHFKNDRLQIVGREEAGYLLSLPEEVRWERLRLYSAQGMPAAIATHSLGVLPEMIEIARECGIPILRTAEPTSRFISWLNRYLSKELAPRTLIHAGLVDVAGVGVMILGQSGMGKSETTMELIRRGHRLIADDTVEVRKPSVYELLARSPDVQRHFMEIKGIGIVNVKHLFGIGAVMMEGQVNLVVSLERWDANTDYSGAPLTYDILGMEIPLLVIPVEPGRNLALVIEAAAMAQRAREMQA